MGCLGWERSWVPAAGHQWNRRLALGILLGPERGAGPWGAGSRVAGPRSETDSCHSLIFSSQVQSDLERVK